MIPVARPGQEIARLALLAGFGAYGCQAPVSTGLPKAPPTQFVVLSRIGGTDPDFASDQIMVLVECYNQSELEAERLANTALAALRWCHGRVIDGTIIRWRRESGPAKHTNPDTAKHARFQFTGALTASL